MRGARAVPPGRTGQALLVLVTLMSVVVGVEAVRLGTFPGTAVLLLLGTVAVLLAVDQSRRASAAQAHRHARAVARATEATEAARRGSATSLEALGARLSAGTTSAVDTARQQVEGRLQQEADRVGDRLTARLDEAAHGTGRALRRLGARHDTHDAELARTVRRVGTADRTARLAFRALHEEVDALASATGALPGGQDVAERMGRALASWLAAEGPSAVESRLATAIAVAFAPGTAPLVHLGGPGSARVVALAQALARSDRTVLHVARDPREAAALQSDPLLQGLPSFVVVVATPPTGPPGADGGEPLDAATVLLDDTRDLSQVDPARLVGGDGGPAPGGLLHLRRPDRPGTIELDLASGRTWGTSGGWLVSRPPAL